MERTCWKMQKKNKKIMIALACIALVILAFAIVTLTTKSDGGKVQPKSSTTKSSKADAEALIGETISQEEVEQQLGEWKEFDMSSEGCERGVYAGRFYYEGFTIFSKTYDKGKTFRIVSVNE